MNILVLGSEGFIGRYLVYRFVAKGYRVFGCDLLPEKSSLHTYRQISVLSPDFESYFSAQQVDVCINASGSGSVPYSLAQTPGDFDDNTASVMKVLDVIRKVRPSCRYVHISSAAVYGSPKQLPIKETDMITPVSPYGFHKWMSEIICREYHQIYALPAAVIRPFSVYGAQLRKQLLWDICCRLQKEDTIHLFGTGNETRDFIHIEDLASLVDLVVEKSPFDCNIYNAGSGSETSIRQVADTVVAQFKGEKSVIFSGEMRAGDPLNWKADISTVSALGFAPAVPLEDGIKSYIEWFRKSCEIE